MAITIQLPEEIERDLRRQMPNLDDVVREQFLLASYREGKISSGELADILGFETRQEALEWLSQRGEPIAYSLSDLDEDRKTLDSLFGRR